MHLVGLSFWSSVRLVLLFGGPVSQPRSKAIPGYVLKSGNGGL